MSTSANPDEDDGFCNCRSTCATKRGKKKGCPCKTAARHCCTLCSCGSNSKKPCCNRPVRPGEDNPIQDRRNQPEDETQLAEEEERRLENQRVKEFILTLDDEMVRNLAIRSLQRGVGSMEYIDMLLILEDPDETGQSAGPSSRTSTALTSLLPPTTSNQGTSSASSTTLFATPLTSSLENPLEPLPEWCKCGRCRIMPQEVENKCCKKKDCVSQTRRFRKLCLDPDYLQLSIKNTADIRNDRQDNSSSAFRKAAYRHYIMDKYGYLGKNKRKVCPSCCVWEIRHHYSSATGIYMGFRSH